MPRLTPSQMDTANALIDFALGAMEHVAHLGLIHANPKWKAGIELITLLVEEADKDEPNPPFTAEERFEFVQYRKFLAMLPAIEAFMAATDAVVVKFARDTLEQLEHVREGLIRAGKLGAALQVTMQIELVRRVVEQEKDRPTPTDAPSTSN